MSITKVIFKNTLSLPSSGNNITFNFSFTSNNQKFESMCFYSNRIDYVDNFEDLNITTVYSNGTWTNGYQIIKADSEQANFKTFLTAMANNIKSAKVRQANKQELGGAIANNNDIALSSK